MDDAKSFDDVWERELYGKGLHVSRYPYDAVVTFVYRNHPRNRPRHEVRIVEIGCGAGNNLWFAAREGFAVAGVDGSKSAIDIARARFEKEALVGDFRVADFTSELPFEDGDFDLALDRGALVCCGRAAAARAIAEVHRILRPGGRFFFNPYSDVHSTAASGRPGPDGLTLDASAGSLVGVGQLCFYGRSDVLSALRGWKILSMQHVETVEMLQPVRTVHAEWRVIAEKEDA
jgi:SAM-dependent methyltransferase